VRGASRPARLPLPPDSYQLGALWSSRHPDAAGLRARVLCRIPLSSCGADVAESGAPNARLAGDRQGLRGGAPPARDAPLASDVIPGTVLPANVPSPCSAADLGALT
jgi:hypothetical protein